MYKKQNTFLCLLLGLCFSPIFGHGTSLADKFSVLFEFKELDFDYPTAAARKSDIDARNFIPGNPAPIDTDVYHNPGGGLSVTFITMPRFQDGIPVTLGTLVLDNHGKPIVRPYPAWGWHRNPRACNPLRITSVYRIMIDECDRLWVMDSGQLGEEVGCNPQILAFDLRTNRLISRYEIPKDQWTKASTFVTPVVEILSRENYCKSTYVYMADCTGHSIVVYDYQKQTSWIVKDETMKPDPKFEKYTIDGTSFNLTDGILGMALTPFIPGEGRRLFYHALSSDTEHNIKTSDLRNEHLWSLRRPIPDLFKTYAGTRKTQSAAEAIDRDGVQYFGLMATIQVGCFVTKGEYGLPGDYSDIVADNKRTLQFISGMKIKNAPHGEQDLYIISTRFQRAATGTLNPREVNFRIQKANVKHLKAGTKCDPHYTLPPRITTTRRPNTSKGPVVFPENRK